MYTRSGAQLRIEGDVVVKVHRAGTDPVALRHRLRIAKRLASAPARAFVAPLSVEPEPADDASTRWASRWPRVEVLAADSTAAPWAEAGALLARLHRAAVDDDDRTLAPGGPARLRRALAAVHGLRSEHGSVIERAAATIPPQVVSPRRPATLVHGDWHLGQLGRMAGEAGWRLIDVDDLGVGDPVWDLGRPAGFWAAGLVPDGDWDAFVGGYRDAGGPALPPVPADPWQVLDPVARAAVIQAAARGVVTSAEDADDVEVQAALVAACARMRV